MTGLLLVAAGIVAGMVGTAGGITSLTSYPALLAAGVSPLMANVANLVAVTACWPASAAVSLHELRGTRRWLDAGLPTAAVGGATGTVLLLTTPSALFDRVVPLLVAAGSLALLVQPWLTARLRTASMDRRAVSLAVLAGVSVYGGYFGAGAGVMVLATALIFWDKRMPVANAVKNMIVGLTSLVSSVILIVAGPVTWHAVVPLGCGLFVGSLVGPVVARRLPAAAVRWTVAVLGLVLAGKLALDAA